MEDRAESGGRKAKARHRIGRDLSEAARQHRIDRPHEGRDEGRAITGNEFRSEPKLRAPGYQNEGADQAENGPGDVMEFQLLARQKSREQDDEQRPKIIDQAGFRGRREPEREKIERVITEQPEDP